MEGPIQLRDAPSNLNPLNDHTIQTPLRHSQFESKLAKHPDKAWVSWLLRSITDGVSIGYQNTRCTVIGRNLPSSFIHPAVIEAELTNKVSAGRMAGPFPLLAVPNVRCSGLGVVPKKGGKYRMIMHLSAPRGQSVNDAISKDQFSLRYSSLDDAVTLLHQAGPGALMAKIDLKSAFRMIPVRRQDWELLGMQWGDQLYIDKCLPFGLRSAPYLFNQFAEALSWILRENYQVVSHIHYLDDYLLVGAANSDLCHRYMAAMLSLCQHLGIPVATNKLEGPSTSLTFLGVLIDSVKQELSLPMPKLEELKTLTQSWLTRRKCTKRQLLSLVGKLVFAARVVPVGRFFIRRLIDLSCSVQQLNHHIHLNAEARADIHWWQAFLPVWNGKSIFLQSSWTSNEQMELYTDASSTHGYGACFQQEWFRQDWLPHQVDQDIQWKELYAILVAAATWGHRWSGWKIRFYCDNQAIVQSWAKGSSKNKAVMSLLRTLFLTAAKGQFSISLLHIPGRNNSRADALSRNKISLFHSLFPQADPYPVRMVAPAEQIQTSGDTWPTLPSRPLQPVPGRPTR